MTDTTDRMQARRSRGDDGTALVEFAFVASLLLTLVLAIISFGLILSFKQDMTRAAAEGARAGAVAVPTTPLTFAQAAKAAADAAVNEAVLEFGGSFSSAGCSRAGMNCTNVSVAPCSTAVGSPDCVTVKLTYDYDNHPLYGNIPLISEFLPNTVKASSIARINE